MTNNFDKILDKIKKSEVKNKEFFEELKNKLDIDMKDIKHKNLQMRDKKYAEINEAFNKKLNQNEKKIGQLTQEKKQEIIADVENLKQKYLNNKNKAVDYLVKCL